MPADHSSAFSVLKPILAKYEPVLSIQVNSPSEYTVSAQFPSPFPQHKGHPLQFASVRLGKAYASFHLMPLYMCEALQGGVSPSLKKRMQGKTCFNFKNAPGPEVVAELEELTEAAFRQWRDKNWV